jgi:hypothetical protein
LVSALKFVGLPFGGKEDVDFITQGADCALLCFNPELERRISVDNRDQKANERYQHLVFKPD